MPSPLQALAREELAHVENIGNQHQRVEATAQQKKIFSDTMRDLLAGWKYLAAFLGSDAIYYHVVKTDNFPVAATDAVAIYLSDNMEEKALPNGDKSWPGFFHPKWSHDNRVFILAHEGMHVLREDVMWLEQCREQTFVYVPRTPACPTGVLPFVNAIAQRALDCQINSALKADNVGVPVPGACFHPAITHMLSRGEAYAILYDDQQGGGQGKGPGGQPGQPGGQGGSSDPLAGDTREPGSMGDPAGDDSDESSQPRSKADGMKAAKQSAGSRAVAQQRASNAAREAGEGSTACEGLVEASRQPGIDWRSYIQGWLARAAGNSAYNWRKPARPPLTRTLLGEDSYIAPSRGGYGVDTLYYVGDISGSIGPDEHRLILAAMFEMFEELNPKRVAVLWVDTQVVRAEVFLPGDDAEAFYNAKGIPQGGGTCFKPPFAVVEAATTGRGRWPSKMTQGVIGELVEGGMPDGLIYITDLYGEAPDVPPSYPVLWIATTDAAHPWADSPNVSRITLNPQEFV